ncbi:isochorismatase family cysteine hydrolase [Streptomyces sp. NPDC059766]|uniref:isochorismatase family cysteine hydrolase n=1 Tax=Streptomyces sp. NPDC059766 TaxID=3346940 RepID=UPI00365C539B
MHPDVPWQSTGTAISDTEARGGVLGVTPRPPMARMPCWRSEAMVVSEAPLRMPSLRACEDFKQPWKAIEVSNSDNTYEPELTGLLIVDPYNDFLSEGGKLYDYARSTLDALDVVEHMRQVLAAARAAGVRVFIAPHHRWRESDQYSRWKTMLPVQASTAQAHAFADETWGGTFHPDFEPRRGDIVAQEHWLSSGFANTDLDLQLKKTGVRKLVVIGMRANTCIESTVRFGAELGYEVTVVKDAIGSFGAAEMDASLTFSMPEYASAIITTGEIVKKLSA